MNFKPFFRKRALFFTSILFSGIFFSCSNKKPVTLKKWPSRPIQITCSAAPGGGVDMVSRTVARMMEPLLGVKVKVINKSMGRGGAALRDVWNRKHNGYRWGGFSESILPAPVLNAFKGTAKGWTFFMVGGAPGIISVRFDSPYTSLADLLKVAKARKGKINAAASTTGCIWHTKLIMLEKMADVQFNFIPFKGSYPSQLALLSGEVELVLTSLSEQAELIKAKKIRPLAMAEPDSFHFPQIGIIPSLYKAYPSQEKVSLNQWLGFALPKDCPAAVLEKIDAAFQIVMASPEMESFLKKRFLTAFGYSGEKANRLAQNMESYWTWLLYDMQLAEISPQTLGIPKPENP